MMEALKTYTLDVLSVLVPGVLLLVVLFQYDDARDILRQIYVPPIMEGDTAQSLTFLAAAYVAGHFVFFVGSFLDGWVYENVREVFWKDRHKRLLDHIIPVKDCLTKIKDRKVLNVFKWSCAWLIANKPELYSEVERYIAESKLFRSLVVVLLVASIILFREEDTVQLGWISLGLVILCLIRYLTQRLKSIETAYHALITANPSAFQKATEVLENELLIVNGFVAWLLIIQK